MMQTQTQVPPALQVLMSMGAQPTAPGPMGQPIPTIASQKAEQQAQGLQALMPGAAVQANRMAQAMQPVTQGQLQQVMQQQSPGISGLPAPNMQRMAEGGVVGYAGPEGSFVNLSDAEIERLTPDQRKAYYKEMLSRRNAPIPTPSAPSAPAMQPRAGLGIAGAMAKRFVPLALLTEFFGTSDADIATLEKAEQERRAMPVDADARPRGQENYEPAAPIVPPDVAEAQRKAYAQYAGSDRRAPTGVAVPPPRPPVSRPEAPERAPVAATGIATALPAAMTPEEAMASARAGLGIPGTADLRAANREANQAREQMPATGQAGLAALQQQMDAVKRMEEERKRTMASDRVIAQMLGRAAEGLGGGARADVRFMAGQRAAEDAFYERNVALAAKQDAINDANAARIVGNKEKYAEAKLKEIEADRAIAQAEATYAAAIQTNAATVRGQNIGIQEAALKRAHDKEMERIRRATAGMPGETERIFNKFKELKAKDPAAAEEYLQDIERIKGLGKPQDRSILTYAQAAKNVQDLLNSAAGIMEVTNIKKQAKAAGRPEPSLTEIKEMLIQRELQSAGSRTTAAPASALPPGVTVKRIGQ